MPQSKEEHTNKNCLRFTPANLRDANLASNVYETFVHFGNVRAHIYYTSETPTKITVLLALKQKNNHAHHNCLCLSTKMQTCCVLQHQDEVDALLKRVSFIADLKCSCPTGSL